MANFAGWANLTVAAGSNDFAVRALYDEKKQSTDSAATDVGRDFNGRAGSRSGCGGLVVPACFHGCM
jgi:hypothetical protein